MKYRGQEHSPSQQQVSTIPSKNIACYRGRKYYPLEPVAINQPQILDSLRRDFYTYRGVGYTKACHQFPTKLTKTLVRH